jgi:peptidoglycan/LPS O-acetylase OafA/YrhL
MTRTLSIFLDLFRFIAALLVFFHHAAFRQFGTHLYRNFAGTGTEPVIAFFVLSGFVIAYTAQMKDHDIRTYWISRLARLLSVSVAAIALTFVFDSIGNRLDPVFYTQHSLDAFWLRNLQAPEWLRTITTATFTNEIWWLNLWPGTNGPFLSLGYEVAYYLLFSIAFYLRGPLRVSLLAVSALVIGPKILLLLPVWLLGVAGWKIISTRRLSPIGGAVIVLLSLPTYALFIWSQTPALLIQWFLTASGGSDRFGHAEGCIGDLVTGILVTACIIGFAGMQSWFVKPLQFCAAPIRLLASMTFSLYLLHYPLIYLLGAVWRSQGLGSMSALIVVGGTLATVFLVSRVTEVRKDAWRPVLSLMFGSTPTVRQLSQAR